MLPLTREGAHPTWHLADEAFFRSLSRPLYLINTSRGEMVDNAALLSALTDGRVADAVIDVWENEPDIDRRLLQQVFIGTPHIAGYSADGKANATRMSLQAFCRFFRLPEEFHIEPPAPSEPLIRATSRAEALLRIYNPLDDSRRLKASPESFESLRGNYAYRREPSAYRILPIS